MVLNFKITSRCIGSCVKNIYSLVRGTRIFSRNNSYQITSLEINAFVILENVKALSTRARNFVRGVSSRVRESVSRSRERLSRTVASK